MDKRTTMFLSLIVAGIMMSGCKEKYATKQSYFDDAVSVEFIKTHASDGNDYLIFQFYEKGTYEVHFETLSNPIETGSQTPHRPKGIKFWNYTERESPDKKYLPKNFVMNIETTPSKFVITQYILPTFIRITITRDRKSEFHSFY